MKARSATPLPAATAVLAAVLMFGTLRCGGSGPAGPDDSGEIPPPPVAAGPAPLVSVATPVPPARATAAHIAELHAALRNLKAALPQATHVHLFLEETSTEADWLAVLDAVQTEGFRAIVAFTVRDAEGSTIMTRPERVGDTWRTGSLGEFLRCAPCARHPALFAVGAIDEPWHHEKRPFYTTEDLKSLYAHLKSLPPAGTDVPIVLQFSRELWKRIVESPSPSLTWDRGLCDIVQISALEFQDHAYQYELLDQNHTWSRRIVHEKTPDIAIWSSVQVFGRALGPAAGYWFPGEDDLARLLADLTSPRYQAIQPLTGVMLQKWDSEEEEKRALQFTLGDAALAGQPVEQVAAAEAAVDAIRAWLAAFSR